MLFRRDSEIFIVFLHFTIVQKIRKVSIVPVQTIRNSKKQNIQRHIIIKTNKMQIEIKKNRNKVNIYATMYVIILCDVIFNCSPNPWPPFTILFLINYTCVS